MQKYPLPIASLVVAALTISSALGAGPREPVPRAVGQETSSTGPNLFTVRFGQFLHERRNGVH